MTIATRRKIEIEDVVHTVSYKAETLYPRQFMNWLEGFRTGLHMGCDTTEEIKLLFRDLLREADNKTISAPNSFGGYAALAAINTRV